MGLAFYFLDVFDLNSLFNHGKSGILRYMYLVSLKTRISGF